MNRQAFARRKPPLKILRVQDHRLAIMKFPHDAIRLARNRRERLFPFLCFRISPFCPDSRYPEELAIENFDLVFRFSVPSWSLSIQRMQRMTKPELYIGSLQTYPSRSSQLRSLQISHLKRGFFL